EAAPVSETLDARTVREWGRRYSNWGRFGPDDERGTLNFITPERVLAALRLPRHGRVISCGLPFERDGPARGGRWNPIHTMLADGGDVTRRPGGFAYADDAVHMPLQCGTQWDALAHVFYDGRMYGDRDIALVSSSGAAANSIDKIRDGVVGRGVLLDVARHRGVDWLEDGEGIAPEELDACAERQGVTVEPGDVVLLRTGKMARHLEAGSWDGYVGPSPGLSLHCARWIFEREVAAVASDTFCVEVNPPETRDCVMPLHMVSLRNTGLLLGEMFALDTLAEACAEDGEWAFLFAAPPLPITGAVGSPINPLAIK
ncbi:MAG TPA: cyclase family protein, partial [Myxococcota bacterium]|nr:cyclase family protein [Myxococcota bacterium]